MRIDYKCGECDEEETIRTARQRPKTIGTDRESGKEITVKSRIKI